MTPTFWTHCVVASLSNVFSSVCEQPSEEGPQDGGRIPRGAEDHTQLLTEAAQLLPHILHSLHVAEVEKVLTAPRLRRGKTGVSHTSIVTLVIRRVWHLAASGPLVSMVDIEQHDVVPLWARKLLPCCKCLLSLLSSWCVQH